MAERVTINEIDFEEGPAGAAIVRLQSKLRQLEGQSGVGSRTIKSDWDRTGDAFVHRMFSMRQAAEALLGAFTVGGLILGLRSLATEVIKSSDSFEHLQESAGNAHRELLSLVRTTFNVNEGVEGTVGWLDRLAGAMRAVTDAQKEHPAAASAAKHGFIGMLMFGIAGASQMITSLQQIGALTDKIIDKEIAAAQTTPATRLDLGNFIGPLQPGQNDFMAIAGIPIRKAPERERAIRDFREFTDILREAIPLFEQAGAIDPFEGLQDAADQLREDADALAEMTEQARQASIQHQILQDVISSGADLIANALAGNVQSYRAFIRGILIELARMFIIEGIGNLAKGWAALAGFNAASAQFYFRAATLDFAAAAAAGLGARAVGGGAGAGGGARQSAAGNAFVNQQGPPSQNITVIVEGHASEDTVDKIIEAISTRLKDGVAGGNFNGQLMRSKT